MLIGNVGKEPETKVFESLKMVATFSLATSKKIKDRDGNSNSVTQWHRVIVFGKLAEVVEKYIKKGSKIFIEGEIQYREYEKDGQKRYITEIICNGLEMLDKKENTEPAANAENYTDSTNHAVNPAHGSVNDLPQEPIDDSDGLPF